MHGFPDPARPVRWRYVTPARTGRWRHTKQEAQDAAVRAGAGHRDPMTGVFYADVFTDIEWRYGD